MKELLPRSSVSYQFQAVLTAFYCAATRRVTAICLCHQTLRVQMQYLHAVYMRNTTRATQTVTRCAVLSCSVFKVHAYALVRRLRRGLCFARSSVGCVCLARYGYIVAADTRKVKRFFAFFHGLASCTMWEGLHCAKCYTVHGKQGNGCKGVCKAL